MRMRFCRATKVKLFHFQEKCFQVPDQRLFQVALGIFILEVQELQ